MKKTMLWVFLVAVISVISVTGCGKENNTIIQESSGLSASEPSITISEPTATAMWTLGKSYKISYTLTADQSYLLYYWIEFFLVPENDTPIKIWNGSGSFFDAWDGTYWMGSKSVSYWEVGDGMIYIKIPNDLPAGEYSLKAEMRPSGGAHFIAGSRTQAFGLIANPAESATDTDGSPDYSFDDTPNMYNQDLYVTGITEGILYSSSTVSTFTDQCTDEKTLAEYYSRYDGKIGTVSVTCPEGCKNGACIKSSYEGGIG